MRYRVLLPTLLLTLCTSVSQAQNLDGDGLVEVPLYQVEVIIFRHADQSRTTAEIPRSVEPEIADVLDQQLPRLVAGDMLDEEPDTATDDGSIEEQLWWPVTTGLQMAADASRIERLGAYELISHLAWQQPAPDVAIAVPVTATDLGAPLPVSGEFKLYSKRYIHLAVDITLDNSVAGTGLPSFLQTEPSGPAIVDSRRMRFGRTAYFDQPEFGVIAVVNKVEEPQTGQPAG